MSSVSEHDRSVRRLVHDIKHHAPIDRERAKGLSDQDLQMLRSVLSAQLHEHVRCPPRNSVPGPGRYLHSPRQQKPFESHIAPRMAPAVRTCTDDLVEVRRNGPAPGSYDAPTPRSTIAAPISGRPSESIIHSPVFSGPGPGEFDSRVAPVGSRPRDLQCSLKASKNYDVSHRLREAGAKPAPGSYNADVTRRGAARLGLEQVRTTVIMPQKATSPREPQPGPGSADVQRWPSSST